MQNMPIVTVIIPVYNGERFITRAIQSVFNQTMDDFECLIIDDGSTDNTVEKVRNLDFDVNYFYQNHCGVAAARNKGISLAKGKYIAFLDADDYWFSTKLEEQVKVFEDNPDVVLSYTQIEIPGNKKNFSCLQDDEELIEVFYQFRCLFKMHYLCTSSVMVKTQRCLEIGSFDESLITAEDIDFYFKVCWGSVFAKINRELVFKDAIEDSLGKQIRSYQDNLLVIEWLLSRHPEFEEQNKELVQKKILSIYESWIKELIYCGENKEARKVINKSKLYGKINGYFKLYLKSHIKSMLPI